MSHAPPEEVLSPPVIEEGPLECEGMPLMVGPDGSPLAAVTDDMTEEQLIAELKELDATQLAIAESGASAGRLSGVDSVAAAAAVMEVQERALARLNREAELEMRVRMGLDAIAASANEVYESLDSFGLVAAADMDAKVGNVNEPPTNLSKIALIHEAIEQAQDGAAMFNPRNTHATPEQMMAQSSDSAEDSGSRGVAEIGLAEPSNISGHVEDGIFFQARQQRSKHISEALLRLQEESRQLQEQSRLLQERALVMQRQAGLSTGPPAEEVVVPQQAEADQEAAMLKVEQDQLELQIKEALAAGSHAVIESQATLEPRLQVMGSIAGGRPASLGAPIAWNMPAKAGGHPMSTKPPGGSKSSGKVLPRKSALVSPGPDRGGVNRNVSILSPVSAVALRAAAEADASRSGQPSTRERERLDSAGSLDNAPMLPSWSGEDTFNVGRFRSLSPFIALHLVYHYPILAFLISQISSPVR